MSSQHMPQEQNKHNPLTIWETTPPNQRQQLCQLLAHLLYKQVNQALSLRHAQPAPIPQPPSPTTPEAGHE